MDGSRTVSLTQGSVVIEPNLCLDHEEVDTRLLLHAKHAATTHRQIVISSIVVGGTRSFFNFGLAAGSLFVFLIFRIF